MTTTELRTLALALKNRIADSYAALLPAYTEIAQWTLNGADDALPTIAALKAVYNAFNAFEKPDYRLVEEVRALKLTTEEAVALVDQIAPFPHTHLVTDITNFPVTMPPAAHAHDLLQIGGLLLRYNSAEGYLEQSTDAGATWTPLVSESAPPSATAYALSWAGITENTIRISRALPGAWVNGDLQIWMRLFLDAATYGSYLLNAQSFTILCGYDGALGVSYYDSNGDEQTYTDSRTGLTGWHDIGLQWTQATDTAIIYLDGVGGTPLSVGKVDIDTGGEYTIEIGAPKIELSALAWANALTWSASAASVETIGTLTVNLPLSEGSGATTTDSTGTAWTIPAGVVWEALS